MKKHMRSPADRMVRPKDYTTTGVDLAAGPDSMGLQLRIDHLDVHGRPCGGALSGTMPIDTGRRPRSATLTCPDCGAVSRGTSPGGRYLQVHYELPHHPRVKA